MKSEDRLARVERTYHNPGQNILKILDVLRQSRFATCKTKLDIYYNKPGIRVTSRVAERLKNQEIRKCWKHIRLGNIAQYSVSLPEIKLVKKYTKTDSKVFQLCPMLLNFFTLSRIPSPGLQLLIILTKQLNITFNNYKPYFKVFLPQLSSEGRWVEEVGDGDEITSLPLTFCNLQDLCEKLQNCRQNRGTSAVAENVHITLQDKILQINSQVFLWSVLWLIFMVDYLRFRCPVTHSVSIPSSLWIFLKFTIFQRS